MTKMDLVDDEDQESSCSGHQEYFSWISWKCWPCWEHDIFGAWLKHILMRRTRFRRTRDAWVSKADGAQDLGPGRHVCMGAGQEGQE